MGNTLTRALLSGISNTLPSAFQSETNVDPNDYYIGFVSLCDSISKKNLAREIAWLSQNAVVYKTVKLLGLHNTSSLCCGPHTCKHAYNMASGIFRTFDNCTICKHYRSRMKTGDGKIRY